MKRRSSAFIPKPQPTLNIFSPSVGESFGALPTAQTMIWAATRRQAERALSILTPKPQKIYSFVVEPSLGADRVALAYLCEAYDEEVVDVEKNDSRVVMRFHPALAPF